MSIVGYFFWLNFGSGANEAFALTLFQRWFLKDYGQRTTLMLFLVYAILSYLLNFIGAAFTTSYYLQRCGFKNSFHIIFIMGIPTVLVMWLGLGQDTPSLAYLLVIWGVCITSTGPGAIIQNIFLFCGQFFFFICFSPHYLFLFFSPPIKMTFLLPQSFHSLRRCSWDSPCLSMTRVSTPACFAALKHSARPLVLSSLLPALVPVGLKVGAPLMVAVVTQTIGWYQSLATYFLWLPRTVSFCWQRHAL